MEGKVIAVNISEKKGERKKNADSVYLRENFGIEGDAHASGEWHRQVSLLGIESIKKMKATGIDVNPGDFAENITTEGIYLPSLPLGTKITIGNDIEIEVSQIGKVCHDRCAIYYQAGDCVMPKEGIFVRVIKGGWARPGDIIKVKSLEL